MSNRKVIRTVAELRRSRRPHAERIYRQHRDEVPDLIRQLAGSTRGGHDRAFKLLSKMGEFVVPDLLGALDDPDLSSLGADEIIVLLGTTGDQRARNPIWDHLQANLDDEVRFYTAVLSLASLGDERSLPYLRQGLDADDEVVVANCVAGLITVGQMEDLPRLREIHRAHRADREVRFAVANAVLAILEGTDERTFSRTLDEIRTSFADRDLWDDIWTILENQFGPNRRLIH